MFCNNCLKLAYMNTNKPCIKCKSNVLNNISVICEKCSLDQNVCSVCLKKNKSKNYGNIIGCKTCSG